MSKAKKLFNVGSTILNYSLDLAWHGSTDITHFVWVDIIPCFLQSTSQDSHNFVGFGSPSSLILPKLQKCGCPDFCFQESKGWYQPMQGARYLRCHTTSNLGCSSERWNLHWIISFSLWHLTYYLIFFVINVIYLHPS